MILIRAVAMALRAEKTPVRHTSRITAAAKALSPGQMIRIIYQQIRTGVKCPHKRLFNRSCSSDRNKLSRNRTQALQKQRFVKRRRCQAGCPDPLIKNITGLCSQSIGFKNRPNLKRAVSRNLIRPTTLTAVKYRASIQPVTNHNGLSILTGIHEQRSPVITPVDTVTTVIPDRLKTAGFVGTATCAAAIL